MRDFLFLVINHRCVCGHSNQKSLHFLDISVGMHHPSQQVMVPSPTHLLHDITGRAPGDVVKLQKLNREPLCKDLLQVCVETG